MKNLTYFILVSVYLILFASCGLDRKQSKGEDIPQYIYIPKIDGEWWQVAGNPDLGACTSERQEPVDFGVWQAKDGSWQLWSCIRHQKCGKNTRLFYGWEGAQLTDTMWSPRGIMMEADTSFGEVSGGLQAPHVIMKEETYYMLYGGWNSICLAKSSDGKKFDRVINESGTPMLFQGPMMNTRDAMTLLIGDKYHCYYTGHLLKSHPDYENSKLKAAIFCRTSDDLMEWSEPTMVSAGGRVADLDSWGGGDAECPFVVQLEDQFLLFRNQLYGPNNLNTQYCSKSPLDFGVDNDQYEVGQLAIAAPEIIKVGEQYFVAALMPDLNGIRMAKIRFDKKYL